MKIEISSYYDGWCVEVDGVRFIWDQEDDHEVLKDIFAFICPDAEISYEECY